MHGSFMSSTKHKIRVCILLGTFSGITILLVVTTLTTSVSSSLWISFCLDVDSWIFACLLVNMSTLSGTILTCSNCISGCPWPCSAAGEGTKSTDRDACIVAANNGSTYVKKTCISSTCTRVLELDMLILGVLAPGVFVLGVFLLEVLS